ncbi:hypothetical protein CFP65_6801 [Kitasatospora sp. MMS16-BH015]|uniref:aryl-sulfate sulfotransferase n=1 Tax=Kitasatospora sp. MMS16-BH015 TaxID=2018025 RepID=UPI000CA25E82|nr:aryl-sulfate sulfotransferase [Kitasatospora sp. MMS16-BH015]AUG81439.1 hypothetical protein CFP65_6801 [Kitasatospora sp. MMS16-BH015]
MPRVDQNQRRRRGTGLIALDPDAAFPGYTLYAPLTGGGEVHLVDLHGVTAHRWRLPYRPGRHARLLGGALAYNGVLPGEDSLFPMWHKYRGGVMLRAAPDGTVLWEHRDPRQHHDAQHLDGGGVLYAGVEPLRGPAAESVLGGVPGSEAGGTTVWADTITEVGEDGAVRWHWRAADHLDRAEYPLHPDYAREHWPLVNSVTPLADGNVLASLRSVSAVVVISRATGEVLWRSAPGTLAQQHHPTELADGRLLVFDNGVFRPGHDVPFSRVVEIDRESGEVVWEYQDPARESFFAPFMGSAQRLANGNTLVTDSPAGRLFEVTPEGYLCWEYVIPQFGAYTENEVRKLFPAEPNAVFRAYRYAPEEIPWLTGRP